MAISTNSNFTLLVDVAHCRISNHQRSPTSAASIVDADASNDMLEQLLKINVDTVRNSDGSEVLMTGDKMFSRLVPECRIRRIKRGQKTNASAYWFDMTELKMHNGLVRLLFLS